MKFVREPRQDSELEIGKLRSLRLGVDQLRAKHHGRFRHPPYGPRVGLLSPDGERETAWPVAVCGRLGAPNRVVFIGDSENRFGAGELIAHGMKADGVCVIIADTPETGDDINRLARASLGGELKRVILLDPDDTAGGVTRGMFRDRASERARELAEANADAEPLEFSIVGKDELERVHEYGPRTVKTVIQCLQEIIRPAPTEDAAAPSTPRRSVALEPGARTTGTLTPQVPPSPGTRRPGAGPSTT